jgi:hypothetical protein
MVFWSARTGGAYSVRLALTAQAREIVPIGASYAFARGASSPVRAALLGYQRLQSSRRISRMG